MRLSTPSSTLTFARTLDIHTQASVTLILNASLLNSPGPAGAPWLARGVVAVVVTAAIPHATRRFTCKTTRRVRPASRGTRGRGCEGETNTLTALFMCFVHGICSKKNRGFFVFILLVQTLLHIAAISYLLFFFAFVFFHLPFFHSCHCLH